MIPLPFGTSPGSVTVDRVVEPELALADELENDGRREGLGDTRDLEVVVRSHRCLASDVSQSCRQDRRALSVANEKDRAGRAGSNERLEVVLEAGSPVDICSGSLGRRGCRDDGDCCEAGKDRSRKRKPDHDVLLFLARAVTPFRCDRPCETLFSLRARALADGSERWRRRDRFGWLVTLDRTAVLEVWQPLEPRRQVPVPLAEQFHRRR